MTNPNIQAIIPIAGRGMIHRESGQYESGEYRRLIDVELNEQGQLISRRPIRATAPGKTDFQKFTDPWFFIGNWGSAGIVVDSLGVYTISDYSPYDGIRICKMIDLPCDAPSGGGGFLYKHYPFAFHKYNGIDHLVTYRSRNVNPGYRSYHVYTRVNASKEPVYVASEFSGFTDHAVITSNLNNASEVTKPVATFVHKDRLWIVTENQAYFSKATDFTNFTAPDGGFFKFNQQKINDAIAIRDTIYIICDSAVYLITYSTDPNMDSTVREIASGVGGDSVCVYKDSVYFVKGQELYAINGANVIKVFTLDILWEQNVAGVPTLPFKTKVVSFGDYLVFLRVGTWFYDSDARPVGGGTNYGVPYDDTVFKPFNIFNYITSFWSEPIEELPPSLVFLNMNTGSVHGVLFSDSNETIDPWDRGYPSDIMASPVEGEYNSFSLYILTSKWNGSGANGFTYYMKREVPNFKDTPPYDESYNYVTNLPVNVAQKSEIEWPSFVPDGNEYWMKKFRNLLLMGRAPYDAGFRIRFAFDNRPFGPYILISQYAMLDQVSSRPPFPVRVPINQRARSITISISVDPNSGTDLPLLSITDMRLLWGYTKRSPEDNNRY